MVSTIACDRCGSANQVLGVEVAVINEANPMKVTPLLGSDGLDLCAPCRAGLIGWFRDGLAQKRRGL